MQAIVIATAYFLVAHAASSAPADPVATSYNVSASTSSTVASAPIDDVAVVRFNDRFLFPIYGTNDEPAKDRADLVHYRLQETFRQLPDAAHRDAAQVVTVSNTDDLAILLLDYKEIVTVSDADAAHVGETRQQLALDWSSRINSAIKEAEREQEPAYIRWALRQSAWWIAIAATLQAILLVFGPRFGIRPRLPVPLLIWGTTAVRVIDLFPLTRPINTFLVSGGLRPFTLAVMVAVPTAVLAWLWAVVLRRIFPTLPENISGHELAQRTIVRRLTLGRVAEFTGATLLWFVAFIVALTWNGVNLASLLASAGLIGVALGLVAQDSIRDLLAGIYILSDDRYAVGDSIQVGAYEGRVERFNLRVTQIRDLSGRLISLSNRNTTEVANMTATWAQVDFRIGVSYYDNLDKAMEVLKETADQLAVDWKERIVGTPEMLGVDSFGDQNILLRAVIRTPPGDQWAVARELRRRVKLEFDHQGLAILNSMYAPPSAPLKATAAPEVPTT